MLQLLHIQFKANMFKFYFCLNSEIFLKRYNFPIQYRYYQSIPQQKIVRNAF